MMENSDNSFDVQYINQQIPRYSKSFLLEIKGSTSICLTEHFQFKRNFICFQEL